MATSIGLLKGKEGGGSSFSTIPCLEQVVKWSHATIFALLIVMAAAFAPRAEAQPSCPTGFVVTPSPGGIFTFSNPTCYVTTADNGCEMEICYCTGVDPITGEQYYFITRVRLISNCGSSTGNPINMFKLVSETFARDKAQSTNCPPCSQGVETVVRVCGASCWSVAPDCCGGEIWEPCSIEADGWCGFYYDVCCDDVTGEPRISLREIAKVGQGCNVNIDDPGCVPLCE